MTDTMKRNLSNGAILNNLEWFWNLNLEFMTRIFFNIIATARKRLLGNQQFYRLTYNGRPIVSYMLYR